MKVGIGYRNQAAAFVSGRGVAKDALACGITRPDIALAFCGGSVDYDSFYRGLRDVLGEAVPIVGGSAIGLITGTDLSYEGFPAGAAVIESDDLRWRVASASGLDVDERSAGKTLGKLLPDDADSRALLMFYDSLRVPATDKSPPIMNASPPLMDGIQSTRSAPIPIIGAGLLGDYTFSNSIQFCGDHIGKQEVVGVMLSGDVAVYSRIMHGCSPHDGLYHEVTRSEGAMIYEVDGKPVVELIDALYGNREWREQIPVRRLTIGINKGEKFAPFEETNFVNRLIAGVLPNDGGIVLFEPDLPEGTEILFMLRDAQEMIRSVRKNTAAILDTIRQDGRVPMFGLYIDCGGRAASYSWTSAEEAFEVVALFNRHGIPLLGFYSGVEIAPFQGENLGLDWTGVLMVLAK